MTKIFPLLAFALALLHFSLPQGKPTDELEIDRQELVNLENETARAMQLNNATFFRRVYSDDFMGTTAIGVSIDKAALVHSLQYSEAKYDFFIASDIKVRFYQETAVVNALWSYRGRLRGQPFNNQSRIIHIYINGPRGWQAVASQETMLPGQGR